jgi:VanZ family protein
MDHSGNIVKLTGAACPSVPHVFREQARAQRRLALRPPGRVSQLLSMNIRKSYMAKLSKASAWLLVVAITVLSVVPSTSRPITPAAHDLEHFLIYLATGLAFGIGYPRAARRLAIGLVVFAGAIEFVQLFIPGRHSRLSDFIIDAVAVCLGVTVSYLFARLQPFRRQDL